MTHWMIAILPRVLAIGSLGGLLFWVYILRTRRKRCELWARLDERKRIARELHDTFLQGLYGLTMSLQCSIDKLSFDDPVRDDLSQALRRVESTMREGRFLTTSGMQEMTYGQINKPTGRRGDLGYSIGKKQVPSNTLRCAGKMLSRTIVSSLFENPSLIRILVLNSHLQITTKLHSEIVRVRLFLSSRG